MNVKWEPTDAETFWTQFVLLPEGARCISTEGQEIWMLNGKPFLKREYNYLGTEDKYWKVKR